LYRLAGDEDTASFNGFGGVSMIIDQKVVVALGGFWANGKLKFIFGGVFRWQTFPSAVNHDIGFWMIVFNIAEESKNRFFGDHSLGVAISISKSGKARRWLE